MDSSIGIGQRADNGHEVTYRKLVLLSRNINVCDHITGMGLAALTDKPFIVRHCNLPQEPYKTRNQMQLVA